MGDYGSCPGCSTLNRLEEKGLVVFRYMTQTPEERKAANEKLKPGHEAAEYNAALLLTLKGKEIIDAPSA
jgi:hypothetical protein